MVILLESRQPSQSTLVGLEVYRRAVQLAPSAFLALAAACSDLVYQIVPYTFRIFSFPHWSEALSAWSSNHNLCPPQGSDQLKQRSWDSLIVSSVAEVLIHNAPNAQARAQLLAATCEESGAWLQALPISSISLRMDNDTVRVTVALRLGPTICKPHVCQHCSSKVDQFGVHGLSCRMTEGRHFRHSALNDIIHCALSSAKVHSRLEPSGIYRSEGKRLDRITMVRWERGKLLVWDVTCSDAFAGSYAAAASREPGAVAALADRR